MLEIIGTKCVAIPMHMGTRTLILSKRKLYRILIEDSDA